LARIARATCPVVVKFAPDELAAIDAAKGPLPRAVWIKIQCARAADATPQRPTDSRSPRVIRIYGIPRDIAAPRRALGTDL
jgi:hypothetical protein